MANLALRRVLEIHDRLTGVALTREGPERIAHAVHELTGYPVAIEDLYGHLQAWAGPNRPDPYPKEASARREQTLGQALSARKPVREQGRLLMVVRPQKDILGVIALLDPNGTAGAVEELALEYGGTVLALELTHRRSLAEAELRMRRDLVEDLLADATESAQTRAGAVGYDLARSHRVLAVEAAGAPCDGEAFFHAVRRAACELALGSLLVARAGTVVVLANADVAWDGFRAAIEAQIDGRPCRVGVGGPCHGPADFRRSHREAQLALKVQKTAGARNQTTLFDDLAVYQILSEVPDTRSVDNFARRWLGLLLDYDAQRGSQLVATLSRYLECGGNYEATAKGLSVHRSTVRYRLKRIREITGYDLSHPDTFFNLQLASRAWNTLQLMRDS